MRLLDQTDTKFLTLPLSEGEPGEFEYYVFAMKWPITILTHWDIVGVRLRNEASPLLDIRLLHIEEEELGMDDFVPLRDAGNFIAFSPSEFLSLIRFFESILPTGFSPLNESITHFSPLSAGELTKLHVEQWSFDMNRGGGPGSYRLYLPDRGVQSDDAISLLCLPYWQISQSGSNQTSGLEFATFDLRRLDDPQFKPLDSDWRGYMTFNQAAWIEFIALLKQRTYENFVRPSSKG